MTVCCQNKMILREMICFFFLVILTNQLIDKMFNRLIVISGSTNILLKLISNEHLEFPLCCQCLQPPAVASVIHGKE